MTNIAIVNFNSGEMTPETDARKDIEKYVGGCRRCENMIPDVYGNATKRPGTEYVTTAHDIMPEGDYNWSFWFPERSVAKSGLRVIYGYNGVVVSAGNINDIGGDLWGIPAVGHPFLAGQTVEFRGTGNAIFDVVWTIQAETTTNEVVISSGHNFSAITFDGTERMSIEVDMTPVEEFLTSARMATDGTYVYIPCYEEATYDSCVMRWDAATVAMDTTWKVNPAGGWGGSPTYGKSIFVVDNGTNVLIVARHKMVKATIADGTEVWQTTHAGYIYSPSAIVDNIIYVPRSSWDIQMYSLTDGSDLGALADTAHIVADIVGDSDRNIFVGCKPWGAAFPIGGDPAERDINMVIWDTASNTVIKRIQFTAEDGSPYWADIYNGYIYTSYQSASPGEGVNTNIAKLDLEGNILNNINVPFEIASHYWRFDGKLCVVKNSAAELGDIDAICIVDADTMVYEGEMLNTGIIYSDTSFWDKAHPISLVYIFGAYRDIEWVENMEAGTL